MRIISGAHRGRRIELLKEAEGHIRPTSDFAREAIFNILAHSDLGISRHPYMEQPVLDVCCGTGALGLEALSRGASRATFVDKSRDALANARHNAIRMHEDSRIDLVLADVSRLPPAREKYGLVFLDPPYELPLLSPALESLRTAGWLKEDAVIITERDAKTPLMLPEGFKSFDSRRYGRAVIEILHLS